MVKRNSLWLFVILLTLFASCTELTKQQKKSTSNIYEQYKLHQENLEKGVYKIVVPDWSKVICDSLNDTEPQKSSKPTNSYNANLDYYVYLCTGAYSKVFHRTSSCSGFTNCSGEVVRVHRSKVGNRRPCKKCCPY